MLLQTLQNTLKMMHHSSSYHRILIYLESCRSGSMFEHFLPSDMNILAVTAANSTESSYACFYNETLDTFLADSFSYSWMEHSELGDRNSLVLDQILYVINKTSQFGHTSVYGAKHILNVTVENFQGDLYSNTKVYQPVEIQDAVPSDSIHSKEDVM